MLKLLEEFFENAHGRKTVAIELLRLGLRVDSRGKIFFGNIEVPPAKIARALSIDRRVVIATGQAIARDNKLLQIFYRLEPRAFMGNAAKELGFDTIELRADPKKKGIVAAVSKIIADDGIVIRQIMSDDPELFPDPVLTVIIDGKLPSRTMKKLKEAKFAHSLLIK
ncbi:MAG: amino acid-binding ACT domain protein [Candidatus Micrarchaeota archaeon]|nr:amino acid-binding ACT domain protein [Candidatus Micrarchaeota archaeon]